MFNLRGCQDICPLLRCNSIQATSLLCARSFPLLPSCSRAMSTVNPHDFLPQIYVWNTFNIFAGVANAVLLGAILASQRANANANLLNLIFLFVVTSLTGSSLALTGHALDEHPPFPLCLQSALVAMSNVPVEAGAALALVLRVWGSVVIACRPSQRRAVEIVTCLPFLLAIPLISSLPLFIAGLVIGLGERDRVFRGSPFYCVVDHTTLQDASSGLGAAFTFICLVFAAWTTWLLVTTRWNVRRIIEYPGVSYPLVLRTLTFSIFVGVAFVVGVISLVTSFSGVVPDIFLSTCNVAVFFTFATSRPILEFVFHCRRVGSSATPSSRSHRGTAAPTSTGARHELHMFSLTEIYTESDANPKSGGLVEDPPSPWRPYAKESGSPHGDDGDAVAGRLSQDDNAPTGHPYASATPPV
ncbi:unnamed protein product [Mycena citricolor]|uniref:Uncharacterized protein n=1 Tax=Mycena citricolor TaxID=2018698 RepID=A0AAD2K552_9AGAR|nr:unnamed protein product [Mycena citricolor]